jgi:uncharacterized repeat protein (TIGR04138 family)
LAEKLPAANSSMQKLEFGEKLDLIVEQDPRYDREAYFFLRDALDFTVKQRKKSKEGGDHVSGQQLLEGIRQYALKVYGPMVPTVFSYWGVRRCDDFGEMVYNFIREGIFGKTESDSIEHFRSGYDFHEAFVVPYLPEKALAHRPASEIAEELH